MITSKASQTTMSRIATPMIKAAGCVCMSGIVPVWTAIPPRRLVIELGADGDFGFEKSGDRAAGFRGFHRGVKFRLVGSGNGGHQIEMALGDGKTIADFIERDGGRGFQLLRDHARSTKLRRKRHSEAARMSRGQQLFRIGADTVFEASVERIGRLLQYAAV